MGYSMKIIIAQGNPGLQYARTRHNTGFIILDTIASAEDATWKRNDRFKADIAEISYNGEKVMLIKPLSFYNETGQVARAIVDFYKLEPSEDVLVVHDELALPFGTIRIRGKGSDAGNNGIKSLNAHLGDSYARVRVGVWTERREIMDSADFVLSAFTQKEEEILKEDITDEIIKLFESFAKGDLEAQSVKINIQ